MTRFTTTRWSLVLQARQETSRVHTALNALCQMYRPPVLAYIQAQGYTSDAAEDLAQRFFLHFIEDAYHANADPARGRFRSFLITAIKRFLVDAYKEAHRLKRGGGAPHESLDDGSVALADHAANPESAFERAWAMTVLNTAVGKLRNEADRSGKGKLFAHLAEFLVEPADRADYSRAALALNVRPNTLAVAAHRLRHRLRELVIEELKDTVADNADLDDELRVLRGALGATTV